jgi:hypothetical protein
VRYAEPYSIHWFKKVFFSILGGLSLRQALMAFTQGSLQIDRVTLQDGWGILKVFTNADALQWLLLAYFILNVIRYMLATFIFDRSSVMLNDDPNHFGQMLLSRLPKENFAEYTKALKPALETSERPWERRMVFSTIVDIFLSTMTIFFLGAAGGFVDHYLAFALLSVLVLCSDLCQILYQTFFYLYVTQQRCDTVIRSMIDKLSSETSDGHRKELVFELEKIKAKTDEPSFKKLFASWVIIDAIEMGLWLCGIVVFVNQPGSAIVPLITAVLLLVYIADILLNFDHWRHMLGVGSLER